MGTIQSVLIVDDDEKLLAAYRRWGTAALRVHTAASPAAARAVAIDEQPQLAVVDLRLGDASGIELLRELHAIAPRMQLVLYSAYLSVAHAVEAMRAGAAHVLFKPLSLREIIARVERDDVEPSPETPTLARVEWEYITRVLGDCEGNISEAARLLGLHRSSLQRRLRKHAPRV